jgi:hypothetical protein
MDLGSEFRDPEKPYVGSRIQGSKRHRIRIRNTAFSVRTHRLGDNSLHSFPDALDCITESQYGSPKGSAATQVPVRIPLYSRYLPYLSPLNYHVCLTLHIYGMVLKGTISALFRTCHILYS